MAFSAVAVFLYQGAISLAAAFLSPLLGETVIGEMTCVGSLLDVYKRQPLFIVQMLLSPVPSVYLPAAPPPETNRTPVYSYYCNTRCQY